MKRGFTPLDLRLLRGLTGFTLLEVLLAMAILAGSLVFIVGGLAGLARHLSRADVQVEASNLAARKILEWSWTLRHGGRPADQAGSGEFEGHPGFGWRSQVVEIPAAENSASPSLYELRLEVFKQVRGVPTFTFLVEGRRRQATEAIGPGS